MSPLAEYNWIIAERPSEAGPSGPDLIHRIRSESRPGEMFQAFDLRSVASARHVESAYVHAQRALRSGQARLRDPGALVALYLAGADQLERALRRVGVREDTRRVLILSAPPRDLTAWVRAHGWTPTGATLPPRPERSALERLEIDSRMLERLPEERWESAVLEHVAMVDFGH